MKKILLSFYELTMGFCFAFFIIQVEIYIKYNDRKAKVRGLSSC